MKELKDITKQTDEEKIASLKDFLKRSSLKQ